MTFAPTPPSRSRSACSSGSGSIAFLTASTAIVQIRSDPVMRGRVLALQAIVFLGSTPIGGPIVGWICEHVGPRYGVAVGAVAALGAGRLGARAKARRCAPAEPLTGRRRPSVPSSSPSRTSTTTSPRPRTCRSQPRARASGHEDGLADQLTVEHRLEDGTRVRERRPVRMPAGAGDRRRPPRGSRRASPAGRAGSRPVHAPQSTPISVRLLSRTRLAGSFGMPAGEPEHEEPAVPPGGPRAPARRSSPPTGSTTTSTPPPRQLLRPDLEVLGRVVDDVGRADRIARPSSFSALDAAAMTRAPSATRDVDRREPDAAAGAEHEHRLARRDRRAAGQREPHRAVALHQSRGPIEVERVRHPHQRGGRDDDVGCVRAEGHREHAVADRDIRRRRRRRAADPPGQLHPRRERRRDLDLVVPGDGERVGEVHARGLDRDDDLHPVPRRDRAPRRASASRAGRTRSRRCGARAGTLRRRPRASATMAPMNPSRAWMSWSSGKDSAFALAEARADPGLDVVGLLVTVNAAADRVAMHAVRRRVAGGAGSTARAAAPRRRDPVPVPERGLRGAHDRRDGRGDARTASSASCSATCSSRTCATTGAARSNRRGSSRSSRSGSGRPIGSPARWSTTGVARDPHLRRPARPARVRSPAARSTRRCSTDLPAGVDPCGEHGEFHSFVWDGPGFSTPIPVATGEVVERDGFVFCDVLPA